MNEYRLLDRTKCIGAALTFIFYPILVGIAFAVHPNLLSLNISHDIQERINEFHGNQNRCIAGSVGI